MPFVVRDNASGDIVGCTRYFNVDAVNRRARDRPHLVREARAAHAAQHRMQAAAADARVRDAALHRGGVPHALVQPRVARRRSRGSGAKQDGVLRNHQIDAGRRRSATPSCSRSSTTSGRRCGSTCGSSSTSRARRLKRERGQRNGGGAAAGVARGGAAQAKPSFDCSQKRLEQRRAAHLQGLQARSARPPAGRGVHGGAGKGERRRQADVDGDSAWLDQGAATIAGRPPTCRLACSTAYRDRISELQAQLPADRARRHGTIPVPGSARAGTGGGLLRDRSADRDGPVRRHRRSSCASRARAAARATPAAIASSGSTRAWPRSSGRPRARS